MKWPTFVVLALFCLASVTATVERKSRRDEDKLSKSSADFRDEEDDDDFSDSVEDFDFEEAKSEAPDVSKGLKDMYTTWNSVDLCRDVECKKNEHCVIKSKESAVCVANNKIRKQKKETKRDKLNEKQRRNDRKDNSFESDETDFEKRPTKKNKQSKSCKPCPVLRPEFVCGSDNSTYSSTCRVDFHNCVHNSKIEVSCKGFCPCKAYKNNDKWSKLYSKYSSKKSALNNFKKAKLDSKSTPKSKYSMDVGKMHNSVLPVSEKQNYVSKHHFCSNEELMVMGTRLHDWFSVVLADQKRKHKDKKRFKLLFKLPDCKTEVAWMYHHLDADGDMRLSQKELFDLEHDENEQCLKQYLDGCDEDRDNFLSPYEWCTCFDQKSQPCAIAVRHSKKGLLGAYVPQCDESGFYAPTQCHGSSGMCWCTDKNGVEFTNTRRKGSRPDCEGMLTRARQKNSGYESDDDEDNDFESSGNGQIDV